MRRRRYHAIVLPFSHLPIYRPRTHDAVDLQVWCLLERRRRTQLFVVPYQGVGGCWASKCDRSDSFSISLSLSLRVCRYHGIMWVGASGELSRAIALAESFALSLLLLLSGYVLKDNDSDIVQRSFFQRQMVGFGWF